MSSLSIEKPRLRPHAARGSRALLQGALPWLEGFGRPILKVVGLALLLAALGATAPLAVMGLVDALAKVAGQLGSVPVAPKATRAILLALAVVAATELAQVWLSRLLEARSWQVRLNL